MTTSEEEVAGSVSFPTPFAYSCDGDCQSFYSCCFFLDLSLQSAGPSPCFSHVIESCSLCGLLSNTSPGYTHDNDCMYINGTGTEVYDFYIQVRPGAAGNSSNFLYQLNRCGTLGGSDHNKRDVKNTKPTKNYMWNTVTIQYNPLIEEEWDEHFKVRIKQQFVNKSD